MNANQPLVLHFVDSEAWKMQSIELVGVNAAAWRSAILAGNTDNVQALLKANREFAQEKVEYMLPLYIAAKKGFAPIVSLLLQYGAVSSGLEPQQEGLRYNSVMAAIMEGHTAVVEVLLREGKVDPNYQSHGTSAVILAAHHHHLSIVKLLDQYGANLNFKATDGSNALIETSRWTSHPHLVEYLVDRGVACDVEDDRGMTPLMYLANIGDLESIRILVEKGGANLAHAHRDDGSTVLSIAERRKMSEVVCYCWKRGLTPSNAALPCHLGDLHISRPRCNFSIGGRYQAAAASVGSKIFVYGGHAIPHSRTIPVVQGLEAQEDELSIPSTEVSSAHSPLADEHQGHNAQRGAHHDQQEGDGENANEGEAGGADDDHENVGRNDNALERRLELAFLRFMEQAEAVAAETGVPMPGQEELMQAFLEAFLRGEIDIGFRNRRRAREAGGGGGDDEEDEEDEEEQDGVGDGGKANNEDAHVDAAKDDSSSDDSSGGDNDNRDEDSGDEDDAFGELSAFPSFDTFVLDLDDCHMSPVFPNPQMPAKLKKITLDAVRKGRWMRIDEDNLGGGTLNPPADESFPPCLAVAARSFNAKRGLFGYFELHVINPGPRRLLTLGLLPHGYPVEGKQPGWNPGSFGLHGDDGAIFCQAGAGDAFADRFEPGDVIGCGVHWPSHEVFFSVNGRFIGFADTKAKSNRLYACVGVRNEDASFRVNFGAEPFRFDFRAPTIAWSKLNPLKTTHVPKFRHPHFFTEPSGKYLVLCAPSSTHDVYLFNVEKMAYTKRLTKGALPDRFRNSIEIMYAQIESRSVFMFLPHSRTHGPCIGLLDTLLLEWYDIGSRNEAFISGSAPQCEHGAQWLELIAALDNDDFTKCWFMAIDGKLVWTSKESYIVADATTGLFSQQRLGSKSVTLTTQSSNVGMGDSAVCFAGWDGHNQRNDIAIFMMARGDWYTPTSTGVIPRPRNAHNGLVAHTRCSYFGPNAADLPSGMLLPEPQPIIINAFGWSGRKVMDDFDIFHFGSAPSDNAINMNFPHDILIQLVSSSTGATTTIQAHKIVLYCRSSKFHKLLSSDPSADSLRLKVGTVESFQGMIHFLYTDGISREPSWLAEHSRKLAILVEEWAPELSPRLLERLLLTRTTLPNIFSSQMLQGYDNGLFSDLTLEVVGTSLATSSSGMDISTVTTRIPVHKIIITSRSPYFKALCMGGMVESSQSVIRVNDVPIDALRLVIEFLYTYEVPYDRCSEHIVDMFLLACRFQVSKLKSILENLLIFNLSVDNVSGLILVAHTQSSKPLLTECAAFIKAHQQELLQQPDYVELADQIQPILDTLRTSH